VHTSGQLLFIVNRQAVDISWHAALELEWLLWLWLWLLLLVVVVVLLLLLLVLLVW
jgi:hypothetical protein